jgi:deazaflavin-dependent oxidoreductase (nitroreductase family)
MVEEGSSVIGYLTTTGRVTGKPHTVCLRLVSHQGRVYASRRDARSDWCRNALRNPAVTVDLAGQRFDGTANLVTDCEPRRTISQLKYSDRRRSEPRTVIEISLCGRLRKLKVKVTHRGWPKLIFRRGT